PALRLWPSSMAARAEQGPKAKTEWESVVAYLDVFSGKERKNWGLVGAGMKEPVCFKKPEAFLNKMVAWDVASLLPDDYLMKVNKSSMAKSVEARVPFLDKALMEFAASMPVRFKASPSATRILQRKAMKGLVPEKIVSRKKHGFNIPTKKWLGEGLKEVSAQLFDSLGNRGYFQKDKLVKFLHSYGRNESLDSRKFWAFLGFEIWHRTFLDPDKPKMVKV
ncbi:hypothetical protein HZC09_02495, partial [Candidatus Micrarchaeota archaeon]|nr:hypothetical protein [Candidatus Micrarchaeota archaeon]